MVNADEYVRDFLKAYEESGATDVYAYKVNGRSIKATAMLIYKGPITLVSYLFSSGKVVIVSDVTWALGEVKCAGEHTEMLIDIYQPPELVKLCLTPWPRWPGLMLASVASGDYRRTLVYAELNRNYSYKMLLETIVKMLRAVKNPI